MQRDEMDNKLDLEDCLEDSPQTRSLLKVFEEDAQKLNSYSFMLKKCCQRILTAQNELTAATQTLSQLLGGYRQQKFPLETDDDSVLATTLKQFSEYLDDVSSYHQVLATQIADTVVFPLDKFIKTDLSDIAHLHEMYQTATQEHDEAVGRFLRLSKKKDNEKTRASAEEEVFVYRKKFHRASLRYYTALNCLQYRRKYALLEPVLGYMQGLKFFFGGGGERLAKVDEFFANISNGIQNVHTEFNLYAAEATDLVEHLEKEKRHLYSPRPCEEIAQLPINSNLMQKAGYLEQRKPAALLGHKWERSYFFTQGGNLMSQSRGEFGGALAVEIEAGVVAERIDADDRRFVFQITKENKSLTLQAECERDADEWLVVVRNMAGDSGYVKGAAPVSSTTNAKREVLKSGGNAATARARDKKAEKKAQPQRAPPVGGSSWYVDEAQPSRPHGFSAVVSQDSQVSVDALLSTPIQFDMISPTEEDKSILQQAAAASPKRVNPFDEKAGADADAVETEKEDGGGNSFMVRFLGSIEVTSDRGESLVHETMRHILAARAMYNVMRTCESELRVSEKSVRLLEPLTQAARATFVLQDISFWAAHKDDNRLFAFITAGRGDEKKKFTCHVFESNSNGEEICDSLKNATTAVFKSLMREQRSKSEDAKVDEEVCQGASGDEGQQEKAGEEENSMLNFRGERDQVGDGDEREVEGAESAA